MRTIKFRNNSNSVILSATVHEDFYVNNDKTFAKGTVRHYSGKKPNGEYYPSVFMNVVLLAPKGEKLPYDEALLKKDARVIVKGYLNPVHEEFTAKDGTSVSRDTLQIVVGKNGEYKANEEVMVGSKSYLANENAIVISGCMVSDLTVSDKFAYGRIAHNSGKDKDGNDRPAAFLDINIFPEKDGDSLAINAANFKKGSFVVVDGYFRNREYEKDGKKRTSLSIVVNGRGSLKANPVTEITIDENGNVIKSDEDMPENI